MRKLLILVVAALVLAGCGTSGGSDADEPTTTKATDKKAEETTTTEADDGPPVTVDDEVAGLTADDYTSALITNLTAGSVDDGDLVLASEEAECVAPEWVDIWTVELLQQADVTDEDVAEVGWNPEDLELEASDGEAMVEAMKGCDVDLDALLAEALTMGFTDEQIACVGEEIDSEQVDALLSKAFIGQEADSEFEALIGSLTTACNLPPD